MAIYIYSLDTIENTKPDQAITTEKDDNEINNDGPKLIDIPKTFPKLSRLNLTFGKANTS